MADTERYHSKIVHFPEASPDEERIAAVLITQAPDGTTRAYVKDFPHRRQPDPEAVMLLKDSTYINNL